MSNDGNGSDGNGDGNGDGSGGGAVMGVYHPEISAYSEDLHKIQTDHPKASLALWF